MNHASISLLASLVLTLGLVACKSGGEQKGPASAPASAPAAQTDAHHGDGHHDDHAKAGHHGHDASEKAPQVFDAPPPVGTKAMCAVSGEVFTVEADTDRAEHDGKHYVFCCSRCVDKFNADPHKFAHK